MSVHTCSYHCDRLECIRAQRDELLQKLEQAETREWAMQQMVAENQRLGLYDDTPPTCQDNRQVDLIDALELQDVVKQFFERFLNRVEDSDSGKLFNPVYVSCYRALMIMPLHEILERMRVLSGAKPNPLYEENK